MAHFQPAVLRVRALRAAEDGIYLAVRECPAGPTARDYGEYALVFALRVLADAPELGTATRPLHALLFDLETNGGWR
ncbi:hypothetical protein B0I33_105142 [Prauserella shujinwangii]|uniref:Uncharacterized protein n=1 Tax=Prauserella shujinwangii TaxID=1453103 RepID=A0A2T0LUP1_9PSEU|nr:hypothetical protein [Prauserella shujinwangii]PRX47563.1 hypothetical protein B0I33_105142 [Prauserella shujinwangii]